MAVQPNQFRAGVFEVFRVTGAGPYDDWCAAGDDIDRIENMPPNTRIHLLRPEGPSQRRTCHTSATFNIVKYPEIGDAGEAAQGVGLSIRQVGANLRAAPARSGCRYSDRRHGVRGVLGGF